MEPLESMIKYLPPGFHNPLIPESSNRLMNISKQVKSMSQELLEKMNRIEMLLLEIHSKIDNFLGFEELSEEERKEIELIEKEVESGEYFTFDEVFGD